MNISHRVVIWLLFLSSIYSSLFSDENAPHPGIVCPNTKELLTHINNTILSSIHKEIYMPILDPNYNGRCAWFQAPKITTSTGIGHAASVFNYNLKVALQFGLGYYSNYGPTGHLQSSKEVGEYFGLGCLFHNARQPPENSNRIKVTLTSIDMSYRRRKTQLSCEKGHTIFDMGPHTGGMRADCKYNTTLPLLQAIFTYMYDNTLIRRGASYVTRREKYLPNKVKINKQNNHTNIAIHVRRGDILELKKDRESRLVNFIEQERLIRLILASLPHTPTTPATTSTTTTNPTSTNTTNPTSTNNISTHNTYNYTYKTPVSIYILTEKAPDTNSILDYNLTTNKEFIVNVKHQLYDVCNIHILCNIYIMSDETSALSSFTIMCESDVLVTTASGFSHFAAELCPNPKLGMCTCICMYM